MKNLFDNSHHAKMSSQLAELWGILWFYIFYSEIHEKCQITGCRVRGDPWPLPGSFLHCCLGPDTIHASSIEIKMLTIERYMRHFRFHEELFIYANLHLATFLNFSLTLASSCKCKCNCVSWWAAPPIRMEHLLTAHELLSIRNDVRKGVADNEASSQNLHLKGRHKNCPLGDI